MHLMPLLHIDAPSFTNAGGVIVLPLILLFLAMASSVALRDWADRPDQTEPSKEGTS